jgi:ribonuclease HI
VKEWHLYIDGASLGNPGSSGAGIVAYDEEGNEVWRDSIHLGHMTNNMAEYEALIHALRKVAHSAVRRASVYTDSLLVANQMLGKYKVRNEVLMGYLNEAKVLARDFMSFHIRYIPREKNRLADSLAKKGASQKTE